jgi:hypothetical protein
MIIAYKVSKTKYKKKPNLLKNRGGKPRILMVRILLSEEMAELPWGGSSAFLLGERRY